MSAILTAAGVKIAKRVLAVVVPVVAVLVMLGVMMMTMIAGGSGGSAGGSAAGCIPGGSGVPSEPNQLKVTYFGDSVAKLVEPKLRPSVGSLTVYAEVGRQAEDVFAAMKEHQGEAAGSDVVIVATGNNGTVDEAQFRSALAGYKETKLLLIVKPYVKKSWEKQAQDAITKVAASSGTHAKLVDWAAKANTNAATYFLPGEAVHPTDTGAQALATLLTTAMGNSTGTGSTPGGSFKITPSEPYHGASSPDAHAVTVDAAALRNVAAVIAEARKAWPDDKARQDKAVLIAVITMATEAGLHNPASRAVPGSERYPNDGIVPGDHDSIGIFQQRAGMGYGTVEQIMTPAFAARSFFGVKQAGVAQWGLLQWESRKGSDWTTLPPGDVAADIQRPAASARYRYQLWVRDAPKVIQAASGEVPALDNTNPECQPNPDAPYDPVPGQAGPDGDTYLPWWSQYGGYPGKPGYIQDPNSFYWGECVSYAAFMVKTTTEYKEFHNNWRTHWGHAKNWYGAAQRAGVPVDKTPAPGSIGVTLSGPYGHVAYIKAVNPDGTLNVTDYNAIAGPHRFGSKNNVNTKTAPGYLRFDYYVHFERPRGKQ